MKTKNPLVRRSVRLRGVPGIMKTVGALAVCYLLSAIRRGVLSADGLQLLAVCLSSCPAFRRSLL